MIISNAVESRFLVPNVPQRSELKRYTGYFHFYKLVEQQYIRLFERFFFISIIIFQFKKHAFKTYLKHIKKCKPDKREISLPSVIPRNVGEKIKKALEEKETVCVEPRFFESSPGEKSEKQKKAELRKFLKECHPSQNPKNQNAASDAVQRKNRYYKNLADTYHDGMIVQDDEVAENLDFLVKFRTQIY